jgi:creatine kinase
VQTSSGVTLLDCIGSGLAHSDSAIGVYAGDSDSLERFGLLFAPVIRDWHGCAHAHHAYQRDVSADELVLPNPDPQGHCIRSTRIRLARNLPGYRLMPTITQGELLQVQARVQTAVSGLKHDLAGSYQALGTTGQLGFDASDRFQQAAGICRAWPQGRGVFSNPARSLQLWVNEEDHLRIISLQADADIGAVYARLLRACSHLEKSLSFQYSERYGYLASCPSNLGTGLRASFHIHLPRSGGGPQFWALCAQHAIAVRSVAGESGRQQGAVYDISNRHRLGLSPLRCIQQLLAGTARLIALEKSLQP